MKLTAEAKTADDMLDYGNGCRQPVASLMLCSRATRSNRAIRCSRCDSSFSHPGLNRYGGLTLASEMHWLGVLGWHGLIGIALVAGAAAMYFLAIDPAKLRTRELQQEAMSIRAFSRANADGCGQVFGTGL